MRLILFASVASLLIGGCTRDNPAFGMSSGSGGETLGPIGDGDGDDEVGSTAASEVGTESEGESGDGDGDGDDLLPDCAEGVYDWFTIPIYEDNYVYSGYSDGGACLLDPGDPNSGGTFPPIYGPDGTPCPDLNFGYVPDFFLSTGQETNTAYLGRLDLEEFTGRGIQVQQAHYKFAVPWTAIPGEVVMTLAPIADDQAEWQAGTGSGHAVIEGESSFTYRSSPHMWGEGGVMGAADVSKQLTGQWIEGDGSFEVEVPYGRVQGWLDQEGRFDPGFLMWSDVVEPFSFYVGSAESPSPPALWVQGCLE